MRCLICTQFLFFILSSNSFASDKIDTFNVTLISKDTTFFLYCHHTGEIYYYQDKKDSIYLKLGYVGSGRDMGICYISPSYNFKSTAPEGVYNIYVVSKTGSDSSLLRQIRVCNCQSLRQGYNINESLIRFFYKSENNYYDGKCLGFYDSGVQQFEKTYSSGLLTEEKAWHENEDFRSHIIYKSNSTGIEVGLWFFQDGAHRQNYYDTLIYEYYPIGYPAHLKSIQRYSLYPRALIEYKFWSIENTLLFHWKYIDNERSIIVDYNDSLKKVFPKLMYSNLAECDSMQRQDSIVEYDGFVHPRKTGVNTDYYYNKHLKARGIFDDNKLIEGKYYIYNCEGVLTRILIFRDGKYFRDGDMEK